MFTYKPYGVRSPEQGEARRTFDLRPGKKGSVETCAVCFDPIPHGHNHNRNCSVQFCYGCLVWICDDCITEQRIDGERFRLCTGCREEAD